MYYIGCIIILYYLKNYCKLKKKENAKNHKTNHEYSYLTSTQVLQLII